MKNLAVFLVFIVPFLSFSQLLTDGEYYHLNHQSFFENGNSETYLLDSIIRNHINSEEVTVKLLYSYYPDGKLKSYIDICVNCTGRMTADKTEYKYDQYGRVNEEIDFIGDDNMNWTYNEKTLTTWFDDRFFSERIEYLFNGIKWDPVSRKKRVDLDLPDSLLTYNMNWNSTILNWDTVSKNISHFESVGGLLTETYTYSKGNPWKIIELVSREYFANNKIHYERHYSSNNNGGTYDFIYLYEFEYTSEWLLTERWKRWDGWDWWCRNRWTYDEFERLWREYYFVKYPGEPESNGGIIYKYYYDDLDLITHRNVFSSNSGTHYSNDFYYYSIQTVQIDEKKDNDLKISPNPFINKVTIDFNLGEVANQIQLVIYDQIGNQVEIIQQDQFQGKQQITWDASGQPPGMYYFQLRAGGQVASGKMLLVR